MSPEILHFQLSTFYSKPYTLKPTPYTFNQPRRLCVSASNSDVCNQRRLESGRKEVERFLGGECALFWLGNTDFPSPILSYNSLSTEKSLIIPCVSIRLRLHDDARLQSEESYLLFVEFRKTLRIQAAFVKNLQRICTNS